MESVAILIVLFLMGIHEHLKRSHVCIHIQANHGAISICPEFWHPSQRPPPTKNRREKAKTKPKQKTKPKPKPKKKKQLSRCTSRRCCYGGFLEGREL